LPNFAGEPADALPGSIAVCRTEVGADVRYRQATSSELEYNRNHRGQLSNHTLSH